MRRVLLCVCILLLGAADSVAQQSVPRPKVGLVLEGGGALGLAHIGVLQWLEEHRIPVDYIAGTSMGGLVGGTYATGMTPNEVRVLVTGIDWNSVLRGETDFGDLSFRRKEDRAAFPASFEFGIRHGIAFPGGFNSGHKVDLILDRIGLPYSTLGSFDQLPIPFRCVATELTTRQKHVFASGALSNALRATMSIPGFFTPVRIDNRIYVDGGLLDNLPTDVAREMGAEKVIAVHLENATPAATTPLSSFSVLTEAVAAVVATNERKGMALADSVIKVKLTDFASTDFDHEAEIILRGYQAAEQQFSELLKYQVSEEEWREYLAAREARRINAVPRPQFVRVVGTKPAVAAQLERELQNIVGKPVDIRKIEHELTIWTGTGRFSAVGYSLVQRNGQVGLQVEPTEKEYAPPTVNPSLVIDGSDYQNVRFGVGARITFLDIGRTGAELRTEAMVGSRYRVAVEYHLPLDRTDHWFVSPRAIADDAPLDIYLRDRKLAEYRLQFANAGMDFGYTFNRFNELRAGYEYGWIQYEPAIGNNDIIAAISGRQSGIKVRYALDDVDDRIIPTQGISFHTDFAYIDSRPGAIEKFPALESRLQLFKSVHKENAFFFTASAGSTFGFSDTGVPLYTLGGPFRLSAYGQNEIFTNQFWLGQLGYLHHVADLPPIVGNKVFVLTSYEMAKSYGTPETHRLPVDGTLGVAVETIFGPAFFGASYGDSGHHKFFFQLGRIF